ncbi:hypothetical protein DICPUDRAFT_91872 [Dictyostelium purpureum]|uniref:Uncharacterized protein n=1 Tax=Dictyostelium purpureum TaxID=5786 RepID=F0ZIH7_DICPU|nr:uncharacterized protein DICPUDRAFT_91872 [Dictyostelium purpureum]EGC36281.1 hypothetical protein DICPUDRAFT_91872 [Dictyostelium purpureum]|eukprot:XP_003287227.1 hypothetical protein DICPUDRAFT_91872 [Dictyostelium purpureum]
MLKFKNIFLIVLFLSQIILIFSKDSFFKNYFFYSIEEDGNYSFKSITNDKISYKISKNNIRKPNGMTDEIFELNAKTSIVNAVINSYSDLNKVIAIIGGLYRPLPYKGSEKYEYSYITKHSKKIHYYLVTEEHSKKSCVQNSSSLLLFTEMKEGYPYRVNTSSLISPYSEIEGFDNEWYSSAIGLKETIQVMKLPSNYEEKSIYNNQKILLTYSKIQFCYSQFPEPDGCDPYFKIKRNRMDPQTKCAPPTGCIIPVNCTQVTKPVCEEGYNLIEINEPRYYCPIYYCDILTYYYLNENNIKRNNIKLNK